MPSRTTGGGSSPDRRNESIPRSQPENACQSANSRENHCGGAGTTVIQRPAAYAGNLMPRPAPNQWARRRALLHKVGSFDVSFVDACACEFQSGRERRDLQNVKIIRDTAICSAGTAQASRSISSNPSSFTACRIATATSWTEASSRSSLSAACRILRFLRCAGPGITPCKRSWFKVAGDGSAEPGLPLSNCSRGESNRCNATRIAALEHWSHRHPRLLDFRAGALPLWLR